MDNGKNYNENPILIKESQGWQKFTYGNNTNILYIIKQKMKKDKELASLIELFTIEDNDVGRMKLIEQILISLVDAKNISPKTDDDSLNLQHLYVLENLDKQELISFSQKNNWLPNQNIKLSDVVENEFENLKLEMYAKLMHQIYSDNSFIDDKNRKSGKNTIFEEENNNFFC